jgi:cytochrome c biogenesis protein CcmG/thiol:disulfide interchange protein DsbE
MRTKPTALALCLLLLSGCRRPHLHSILARFHPNPSPEDLVGQPFPDFAFASIPGKDSVRSVDLKGSTPSLVVFWATWCAPCREEVGVLEKVLKDEAPGGVKIVGLSVDDSPAAVPLLVDRLQIPYPVGVGASPFFYSLKLQEIPQVYVLDGNGVVRSSFTEVADEAALRQAIAKARLPG